MAAVARVLPRHWDGQRLLRFLAGLAMVALAFTAHLPAAEPAPAPIAPALIAVEAPVVASGEHTVAGSSENHPVAVRHEVERPAGAMPGDAAAVLGVVLVLGGLVALRGRGLRGPPIG